MRLIKLSERCEIDYVSSEKFLNGETDLQLNGARCHVYMPAAFNAASVNNGGKAGGDGTHEI